MQKKCNSVFRVSLTLVFTYTTRGVLTIYSKCDLFPVSSNEIFRTKKKLRKLLISETAMLKTFLILLLRKQLNYFAPLSLLVGIFCTNRHLKYTKNIEKIVNYLGSEIYCQQNVKKYESIYTCNVNTK